MVAKPSSKFDTKVASEDKKLDADAQGDTLGSSRGKGFNSLESTSPPVKQKRVVNQTVSTDFLQII